MTVLNDDRDRASRGEVAPASLAAPAAEKSAKDPSRVPAPAIRSDGAPDRSPGDAHGDGTAAGVGSTGDTRFREARERADRYLAELIEEVGEPSPEEVAEAEAWAARIERALDEARAAQ